MRFDDNLGEGDWLITRDAVTAHESELPIALHKVSLRDAALKPFHPTLKAWFANHDVEAVLVRPDRFVFGTGDAHQLIASYANALTSQN
ncbi:MAG: hypothetical protein HY269_01880 [Deltaproteobacteria bacterium]|nr:hypothetical protein [Deltaproteobacteria bacterium]